MFLTEDVAPATAVCQRHNVAAEIRFIIAQNWNQLLFLVLIGFILFVPGGLSGLLPARTAVRR